MAEDPLESLPDDVQSDIDSYYDLLEVDYQASRDKIKNAYREKIQEHHPDVSDDEFADDMSFVINQAKDVLLDQSERIMYNEMGHDAYYNKKVATNNHISDDGENKDYDTSVYELIRMAKMSSYDQEPWWKTILKSRGFHITIGIILFLFGMMIFFFLL